VHSTSNESAAGPDDLAAALPDDPPTDWRRSDESGGLVEYRLPGSDGVCAAGKVGIRPDVLGESAVRVDYTRGCRHAGTSYYDDVASAAAAVERALETALLDRQDD
jgi:hypothetical protein